jgi:hypothetical protein
MLDCDKFGLAFTQQTATRELPLLGVSQIVRTSQTSCPEQRSYRHFVKGSLPHWEKSAIVKQRATTQKSSQDKDRVAQTALHRAKKQSC